MKKYYKQLITYSIVLDNGNYLSITELTGKVTIITGVNFYDTDHPRPNIKEITEQEFYTTTAGAFEKFEKTLTEINISENV